MTATDCPKSLWVAPRGCRSCGQKNLWTCCPSREVHNRNLDLYEANRDHGTILTKEFILQEAKPGKRWTLNRLTEVRQRALQFPLNGLNFLLQTEDNHNKGAIMSFDLFHFFCLHVKYYYYDSVDNIMKRKRDKYASKYIKNFTGALKGKNRKFYFWPLYPLSFIFKTSRFIVSCYEHFTQILTSHQLLLFVALRPGSKLIKKNWSSPNH